MQAFFFQTSTCFPLFATWDDKAVAGWPKAID